MSRLTKNQQIIKSILMKVRDAGAVDDNSGGEDWTMSDTIIDESLKEIGQIMSPGEITNSNQQIADEELTRHKLIELRKSRDSHQIDESDYIDAVMDMFADVEAKAYNEGELDTRDYYTKAMDNHLEEDLKQVSTREKSRDDIKEQLIDMLESYGVDTSDEYWDAPGSDYVDSLIQSIQSYIDANYVARDGLVVLLENMKWMTTLDSHHASYNQAINDVMSLVAKEKE